MPRFRRPRSPVHTARRVAAVLLAGFALVLALRPDPLPAAAQGAEVVAVAVSARDLPAGTVLTADDVTVADFAVPSTPAGTVGDPGRLVHRVLAGGVRVGEPITDARLIGPGLTALLPEGQVARRSGWPTWPSPRWCGPATASTSSRLRPTRPPRKWWPAAHSCWPRPEPTTSPRPDCS